MRGRSRGFVIWGVGSGEIVIAGEPWAFVDLVR